MAKAKALIGGDIGPLDNLSTGFRSLAGFSSCSVTLESEFKLLHLSSWQTKDTIINSITTLYGYFSVCMLTVISSLI